MAKRSLSDAEVTAQIPAARKRAERARRLAPHAKEARFERTGRAFCVILSNGAAFTVPVALIAGLRSASDRDLSHVEVGPSWVGLRWERLDADLSVAHLATLALGADVLLRAAGAAGGSARSRAKARAARANGLKGGRPRKHVSSSAA
ncbi:MAG: DUF2442 domain-containing protein [Gammaproteobacteria bacterium]